MNKIHNIVWSKARGAWVVVAEGTKAASKAGGAGLKVMIALIMLTPLAGNAASLPQGGSISVGQGTITTNGSNQMVIKQTTDKLGINWQSFNVGADGHVVFDQPGAHSVALNRVIGSDGSSILGKIDANGQVFLINPNGVIFGKDAKVNVGGLVASTLNMTDADFEAGNYKLKAGATSGEVTNLGSLQATDGGYIALVGKSVKNNGVIRAKLGTAALASGGSVTLDFSGDSLINIQVTDSALKAQVENKGLIKADGGSVLMTARASNALLDTVVNNEGIIEAQTIENRSGKIFLDGGFDGGTVNVAGTLDASAPVAGNGGFIETSGKNVAIADSVKVNTLSNAGKTGEWLVDPADFNINAGTGAKTTNSIGASTLASSLATTNVTLSTVGVTTPGQLGDVNVNADVAWSGNTKLTLNAHHDVNINAKISVNGATGGLVLNPTGRVNTSATGSVKLNGASSTYTENGVSYQVLRTVNDLKQLGLSTASGKQFVLGGDIDATVMNTWNGGQGWAPYGEYYSTYTSVNGTTFNGLGNTISNFYINRPGQRYMGLFGVFYNGKLSNLKMTGSVVGGENTGMVAGELYSSTMFNVIVSGSVKGGNNTGGAVGYAYANKLINNIASTVTATGTGDVTGGILGYSYSNDYINLLRYNGTVVGGYHTGGIIGQSYADTLINDLSTSSTSSVKGDLAVGGAIGGFSPGGTATNISGSGTVTGNTSVGGAIGYVNGNVSNIKSDATVTGGMYVGGLIGEMKYSTLDSSFSTSKVTGTNDSTGGLIGVSTGTTITNSLSTGEVNGKTAVGGLIGTSNSDQISTSFSTSKVTGSQNVGGFGGSMVQSIITDAYATGDVSADTSNSGGFVGLSYSTNYKNTYSTGKNTSASLVGKGGFLGAMDSDVFTSSYWDTEKSGMTTSAGGAIGKTTAQMSQASTFAGWGISSNGAADANAWRIYEGSSAPLLKFLMGTADVSQNNIVTTYTGYAQNPDVTGLNNLSNVQAKSFFSSLLDLTASGLKGGGFSGGPTVLNAGTYSATSALTSNQFGLNLNQTNTGKIIVNKAVLSFNAAASNKVYDATTGVTSTLTANGLGSDVLTVTGYDAKFANKNAGTGKTVNISGITVDGAAASNYTWATSLTSTADIAKATLAVTATGWSKDYDGNNSAGITFSGNKLGSDDVNIGSGAKTYADKNAGVGKTVTAVGLTLFGADASNYLLASTTVSATADIKKRSLTVAATGVDKTYDGTTSASATLADNRVAGDLLSVSSSGATFNDKNAATGKIITVHGITVAGADAANYTWNLTATASAVINKAALLVSASGINKTYDGNTSAGITLSDNRIGSDALVVSAAGKSFTDKNAGLGKTVTVNGISVSGADSGNYTWNTAAVTTADIAKAALSVTASGVNKTYDGTTAGSATFTDNRIGSDDLTISGSSAFGDKNAGTGKLLQVTGIALSGADAGNYSWNASTATTADIGKASLVIGAVGQDKVYDGLTAANVAYTDNRKGLDALTISSSGSFSDKNAGSNKAINVSGINVTGADASNYTWNITATTSANIAKAALLISAVGSNRVYDGSTSASAMLTDDRVAGDDLTIGSKAKFSDKNAAAGKTVTVGEFAVSGADAMNYTWNSTAFTTADITKANLSVGAIGSNKVYDGRTAASVNLTDNRVAGDDLTLGSSASFNNKNAGTGKSVTVSGINVSGADAGNYTWNNVAFTNADIAKANLTISAAGVNKTYDGTTGASVGLSDNRIGSDLLLVSSTSAAFADKNAGTNKLIGVNGINISGADAGNYTWNASAVTSANIDKANLVVTAVGVNKTYDGTSNAAVNLSDNRIGGDSLVLSSNASFDDKNAGAGKIVRVGGIVLSGADAGNYTANASTTATADIAKAGLVVKAENGSKSAGELDGQLKWKLQGGSLFGSDSLSGGLTRDTGEDVGIYGITKGNLSAGSNYDMSVVPGVFEIKQLPKPPVVVPVKPEVNVDLEEAKDIVATVSVATKVAKPKPESVAAAKNETASVMGDYRLLNLGMKLPDDLVPDDKSSF